MACRTFVIASVNGKRVQRSCWHLGTCNKNLAPVLLCIFLPIFPPLPDPYFPNQFIWHGQAAAALDAPQPPLPHQALALLPDSPLSWEGHRQMCKFTSIPPPWSGERTCTSFISLARQGCQLDKCGGRSSSRKPTDAALTSSPLCPSAQRCRPLAAGPTGDPTQAVPRGTWSGWQAVYYILIQLLQS